MNKYVELSNGIKMPAIGFGTYNTGDFSETLESVKIALANGYKQIDTASFYNNEEAVGQGIKESGIPREEIFIVTKVWNDEQGYKNTLKAFENSTKKLGTDYLDLYLIHWPTTLNNETWKALEYLYSQGKVKAIGVCNFKESHLEDLMKMATIMPMVNQIEIHPIRSQKDMISYCENKNIKLIAWGPLSRGKIFNDSLMLELSSKYKKDIGQIILRWHIQNNVIPIPKSSNEERIKSNFNIFDFDISKEDMIKIDKLNSNSLISNVPQGTTY